MYKTFIYAFLTAFIVAILIGKPIIEWMKKLKARQSILEYVDLHKTKQGTPTMGGLIFMFAMLIACVIFFKENAFLATLSIIVTLGYALIGFLDDFIKVFYKRNLGLKAYQKVIGQGGLAVIIALFCYYSPLVENSLVLPFSLQTIKIGAWIIPIVIFIFLALTNAVNLTDGLDGLAGSVSFVYLIFFTIVSVIFYFKMYNTGSGEVTLNEYSNLITFGSALAGGILGYLCFNFHPAKIFMGDVGSLGIGAALTCLGVFTGLWLYIPFLGIMFVASTISVIMQVLYYKKTKKRIFLMAPLHHHFEKKGVNETKIVSIYIVITILAGLIMVLLSLP